MIEDLSRHHQPVGTLLAGSSADWEPYRLDTEQLEFFRENGYLKGVRIFTDEQVEILRRELEQLMNPEHAGRHLFHEYHSNESTDPNRVVFHALGAWRVLPGFHDLLWNPAFLVPASQLLGGPVRFWHDQLFLQTGETRRDSGLAPGLLVLDKNDAVGPSNLLDWSRRFHARERLLELYPGEPQMARPAQAQC